MSGRPLVWVPYPVAELELPDDVLAAADVRHVELGRESSSGLSVTPDNAGEVRFLAIPYSFDPSVFDLLSGMTSLEVVQVQFAGVEAMRGKVPGHVTLCSGRGIHDTATSELALTLTLAGLRDLATYVHERDRQVWDQKWHPSLAGARVVIVGAGAIGAAVRRKVEAFEATAVMVARSARPDEGVHGVEELPELVHDAEVVVLILPLTEESRGLVDAELIRAMKPGALLVNVARGAIVDTDALVEACAEGRIRAALDVTDPEPPPPGHPLWTTPGILLTPHIGGTASSFFPRAKRLIAEQVTRYVRGEPLENVVDADY
ncbi:MAG: NAD(P)-dependent oxidoreductase [Nocardioides sp.]|uniref:NAD(P)-dependent oxidoreductase n=1 Tax=Nocardioides sp. TaxID=35761 RepID=UPI0039E2E321